MKLIWSILFCMPLLSAAAELKSPEVPKLNGWYKDGLLYGFKVKAPKDWRFVPPAPDIPHLQAWYEPDTTISMKSCLLILAIDDRKNEAPQTSEEVISSTLSILVKKLYGQSVEDFKIAQMEHGKDMKGTWKRVGPDGSQSELKISGTLGTKSILRHFSNKSGEVIGRSYSTVIQYEPGLRVAYIGYSSEIESEWDKFQAACRAGAKSFKRVKVKPVKSLRSARETMEVSLQVQLKNSPNLTLYELGDYFFMTETKSKSLMKLVKKQLEAHGGFTRGEFGLSEDDFKADPIIVRCFLSVREQWHYYGEHVSSTKDHREWIFKNNEAHCCWAGGGRHRIWKFLADDLVVLAAHHAVGKNPSHEWYLDGHKDFYHHFELKGKSFRPVFCECHGAEARAIVESGVPLDLESFFSHTWPEYRKLAPWPKWKYGGTSWQYQAISWSLIYFLRRGPEESFDGWQSEWEQILPNYMASLKADGDMKKAVEVAFEGIDWDAFEKSWTKVCLGFAKKK